jgi:hypothetical protein
LTSAVVVPSVRIRLRRRVAASVNAASPAARVARTVERMPPPAAAISS